MSKLLGIQSVKLKILKIKFYSNFIWKTKYTKKLIRDKKEKNKKKKKRKVLSIIAFKCSMLRCFWSYIYKICK